MGASSREFYLKDYLLSKIKERIFRRPCFSPHQVDLFLDDNNRFEEERPHRLRPPNFVKDINTLYVYPDSIAVSGLLNCKGIFIIYPNGQKGAIHLLPTPEGINELRKKVAFRNPANSFLGATGVIIAPNGYFFSDEIYYQRDQTSASSWKRTELGLPTMYDLLAAAFPDLIIDRSLFLACEFIKDCTIELTNQGLKVFDYSRIIDRKGGYWFAPRGWHTGNDSLQPIKQVLDEVESGLTAINGELQKKRVIKRG